MLNSSFDICFNPVVFWEGILPPLPLGHLPHSPLCSFPVPSSCCPSALQQVGLELSPAQSIHGHVHAEPVSLSPSISLTSWWTPCRPLFEGSIQLPCHKPTHWCATCYLWKGEQFYPFSKGLLETLSWERCSHCHLHSDFSACKIQTSGDETREPIQLRFKIE